MLHVITLQQRVRDIFYAQPCTDFQGPTAIGCSDNFFFVFFLTWALLLPITAAPYTEQTVCRSLEKVAKNSRKNMLNAIADSSLECRKIRCVFLFSLHTLL